MRDRAFSIRPAEASDLAAITAIYNHYVTETAVTFDIEPYTEEGRRPWFRQFARDGRHRLWVACEGETLLGYAGTIPFRVKAAYETSVETTVYLDAEATGRGIGVQLYETLFRELAGCDIHRVLAGITLPNEASVRLHERFGFERVGVFREVGRKLGRYWDVLWLERPLTLAG